MVYLFIGAYIVLAILVYLMFKLLKGSVDKIGEQTKSYYLEKLEEYDDLINDKEEQINNLNKEIKNKKVEAESIKKDMMNEQVDFDMSIIDVLSRTKYKDKSFIDIEKMIDEEWNFDSEKIIREFLNNDDNLKNYEFCKKLRKKFSSKNIYQLKLLGGSELEKEIKRMLTPSEYMIYDIYIKTHLKFELDEFISYLDELLELNNPNIIVYVGSRRENYDHINKLVKTKVDKNIYRGIKVLYKSKMYDFSLNGRNL